jgi:hypothetical protein
MATSAKRVRALREVERRGLRRFTIGVSEDDLRVIAEHGYEGAASTDLDLRAQAVSLFITDMLAGSIGQGNGVTTVASNGVTTVATPFQSSGK